MYILVASYVIRINISVGHWQSFKETNKVTYLSVLNLVCDLNNISNESTKCPEILLCINDPNKKASISINDHVVTTTLYTWYFCRHLVTSLMKHNKTWGIHYDISYSAGLRGV